MTPIKQADVTLMGFPLQWPMSDTIKRNDLIHETEVMDPYGPAMTHGIFAIAWLDLGIPLSLSLSLSLLSLFVSGNAYFYFSFYRKGCGDVK